MTDRQEETSRDILRDAHRLGRALATAVIHGEREWAAEEVQKLVEKSGLADSEGYTTREGALLAALALELADLVNVINGGWFRACQELRRQAGAEDTDPNLHGVVPTEEGAWELIMQAVEKHGGPTWKDEGSD